MAFDRYVFLNYIFSRSKTRAPREFSPPLHGARELFSMLTALYAKGGAIVYLDAEDDDDPAIAQINRDQSSAIRIRHLQMYETQTNDYVCFLAEHIDNMARSFPVVNRRSFVGRDLEAEAEERGATTAHVVVRLPKEGAFDAGSYRTVIEVVQGVTRRHIDVLLNRQLRQLTEDWSFPVSFPERKGARSRKDYKYRPKLELNADIGRSVTGGPRNSVLSHMVFTKRSERLNTGQEAEVDYIDVIADIEYKIAANQGPENADERQTWLTRIRQRYESIGFSSKLYFRHAAGFILPAGIRHDEATAADMLLCPREIVTIEDEDRRWRAALSEPTLQAMFAIVDRDELWRT
jgi:hypothetical protein